MGLVILEKYVTFDFSSLTFSTLNLVRLGIFQVNGFVETKWKRSFGLQTHVAPIKCHIKL